MGNDVGWVMLHRKILSNPIFKNGKMLQVFMYCLLRASHKEHEHLVGDRIVQLKPGELATGRDAIAAATGLTSQNVRTCLKKLEKLNILTIKSTNKYSLISITNWISHQQINQQVTSSQPASNQQTNHKQEVKNVNNGKNVNNKPSCLDEIFEYFIEKGSTWEEANKFFNYYESNGWKVGKNPMRKWRAAATGWINRNAKLIKQSKPVQQEIGFIEKNTDTTWAEDLK